ncbi:hypothetical protein [Psychromonas ossibalaenae]|uniref:hypothetical protein n=1 Tax=Psychromonas ossibalaenae TaxID=444922 RepID=UPI00035D9C1C|nr:hypothetical protein [Psychromonas ossibalaenae]
MFKQIPLRNTLKMNTNDSAHGIYRLPLLFNLVVSSAFTALFFHLLWTAIYTQQIASYLVPGRVKPVLFAAEPWLFSASTVVTLLMIPACLYSIYLFWAKSDLNAANHN